MNERRLQNMFYARWLAREVEKVCRESPELKFIFDQAARLGSELGRLESEVNDLIRKERAK